MSMTKDHSKQSIKIKWFLFFFLYLNAKQCIKIGLNRKSNVKKQTAPKAHSIWMKNAKKKNNPLDLFTVGIFRVLHVKRLWVNIEIMPYTKIYWQSGMGLCVITLMWRMYAVKTLLSKFKNSQCQSVKSFVCFDYFHSIVCILYLFDACVCVCVCRTTRKRTKCTASNTPRSSYRFDATNLQNLWETLALIKLHLSYHRTYTHIHLCGCDRCEMSLTHMSQEEEWTDLKRMAWKSRKYYVYTRRETSRALKRRQHECVSFEWDGHICLRHSPSQFHEATHAIVQQRRLYNSVHTHELYRRVHRRMNSCCLFPSMRRIHTHARARENNKIKYVCRQQNRYEIYI